MLRGRRATHEGSLRNSRNDRTFDRRVSLVRFTNFNTASPFFPAVVIPVVLLVTITGLYGNRRLILIMAAHRTFVPLLRVPRTNDRNRRIRDITYICTRVTRILRISPHPQHRETDSIISIIYVSIMITSLLSVE